MDTTACVNILGELIGDFVFFTHHDGQTFGF